jgi:hypothetical protein
MGDSRCDAGVLMRRPDGWIKLGRPRLKLEDNIKMCLQKLKWGSMG